MSSESFLSELETLIYARFKINVSNSQIEIDGGFEGIKQLCLVEIKFHIRGFFNQAIILS